MPNFPVVMDPSDLASALLGSKVAAPAATGVVFIRMSFDTGEWTLGSDQEDVTDEEVLILTDSIAHGWVMWVAGVSRPQTVFRPFNEDMPMPMAPVGADEPAEGRSLSGAFLDGQMFQYENSSYGCRKAVDTLLSAIKTRSANGGQHLYPRVKLTSETYPGTGNRNGKTNHNPVFDVIKWCDRDGNAEADEAQQIAAPTNGSGKAVPPTAEPQKRSRRKRGAP